MGNFAEKCLMNSIQFGWEVLDSDQKEMMKAIFKIIKSLPDDKIIEISSRSKSK